MPAVSSLRVIALCVAAMCSGQPSAASAVEWTNCNDPVYRRMPLEPVGAGPLELTKVFCQYISADFKQAVMISPDGRSIVFLQGGSHFSAEHKVLHVSRLEARESWTRHPLTMGPL